MILFWVSLFAGLGIFLSNRLRTLNMGVKIAAFLVVVTLLYFELR